MYVQPIDEFFSIIFLQNVYVVPKRPSTQQFLLAILEKWKCAVDKVKAFWHFANGPLGDLIVSLIKF